VIFLSLTKARRYVQKLPNEGVLKHVTGSLTNPSQTLQLLVFDAAIGIEMLKPSTGRLIVAGDHMVS
jgi:hypothetical protein